MKIEKDILEIIESGHSDGNFYYLPPKQLDRKVYEAVNKVLVALGGKWKGGKFKAHVFEQSIDDAIENVILTGEVTSRKQELNLFETPDRVVDEMIHMAELESGQRILEPEAGRGAILRGIKRTNIGFKFVSWCEIDERNAKDLETLNFGKKLDSDFLSVNPNAIPFVYDRVLMNPPFSMNGVGRQTDIDHVSHALRFLDERGMLVSIMSPAIKYRTNRKTNDFRALLDNHSWEVIDLPEGSFKESGTMINTVILKIGK